MSQENKTLNICYIADVTLVDEEIKTYLSGNWIKGQGHNFIEIQ